jgi:putative flippase GtrA
VGNSAGDRVLPQFVRFAAVGVAGFVVDVAVLYLALHYLDCGPYVGRAISYVAAASSTWFLNRRFTFLNRRSMAIGMEWLKYLLVNGCGGIINYATYVACLHFLGILGVAPFIGVAFGSLAGLSVNFALSRRLVFRKPHPLRSEVG